MDNQAQISLDELPMITAALDFGKTRRHATSLLEMLNSALVQGEIVNPKFLGLKYDFNRLIECLTGWEGVNPAPYHPTDYSLDYSQGNHIAGKIKKAERLCKKAPSKFLTDYIAVSKELLSIYEAMESLTVIKRRPKSEEEKAAQYAPPIPKTEAMIKVTKVLTDLTNDLKNKYAARLKQEYIRLVDHRLVNPRKRGERYFPSFADNLMSMVGENWDSHSGNYTSLKAHYHVLLEDRAMYDANYAQRLFLWKNLTKLTEIIDRKGDLSAQKILEVEVSDLGFMGEIRYDFADGASMTVRNKVIVNTSVHGKQFHQFPTTFHGVKTKLGPFQNPSEERMIEVFPNQ